MNLHNLFCRADAPPMLLITGDRELELLGRYEENDYMLRMMKLAGHKQTTLYELQGFDHGGMAEPAFPLLLKEVKKNRKINSLFKFYRKKIFDLYNLSLLNFYVLLSAFFPFFRFSPLNLQI